MSAYVWVDPANPRNKYMTSRVNDPIPAGLGYILTSTSDGSAQIVDGLTDGNLKKYTGGLWSGGYPAYNGFTDGSASNGILGGGNR
jgi:hypothetical protein